MSLAEPLAPTAPARPQAPAKAPSRSGVAKAALRKAVFQAHLWVGLALSVWFVLLALTGSLLVFKPQVDALLNPGLFRSHAVPVGTPRLQPEAAVAAAVAARPEVSFRRLALPEGPGGVYAFRYGKEKQERELFVDAYSGAVLGEREKHAAALEWVLSLHKSLLLDKAGEQANGIGALLLVGLLATGIYLWWPANAKQWPQRFQVKRGASAKRLLFDLHNAFGIYTLPILLAIAVTGAVFIYKKPVENALYAMTGTPQPVEMKDKEKAGEGKAGEGKPHEGKPHKEKGAREKGPKANKAPVDLTRLPLMAMLETSERLAPGTHLKHIDLPEEAGKPARFHRERRSGFWVNNKVRIQMDPVTAAVVKVEDERTDPLPKRLLRWNGPLHEGKWAGVGTQWLYVLVALLSPLGLVVTGVIKWWQTRQTKARNRSRHQAGAARPVPAGR